MSLRCKSSFSISRNKIFLINMFEFTCLSSKILDYTESEPLNDVDKTSSEPQCTK